MTFAFILFVASKANKVLIGDLILKFSHLTDQQVMRRHAFIKKLKTSEVQRIELIIRLHRKIIKISSSNWFSKLIRM